MSEDLFILSALGVIMSLALALMNIHFCTIETLHGYAKDKELSNTRCVIRWIKMMLISTLCIAGTWFCWRYAVSYVPPPDNNIVFLDTDEIAPNVLAEFNETMAEHPTCRIVVTSDWRIGKSREDLATKLEANGITAEAFGATPDLSPHFGKEQEIKEWIRRYRGKRDHVLVFDKDTLSDLKEIGIQASTLDDAEVILSASTNRVPGLKFGPLPAVEEEVNSLPSMGEDTLPSMGEDKGDNHEIREGEHSGRTVRNNRSPSKLSDGDGGGSCEADPCEVPTSIQRIQSNNGSSTVTQPPWEMPDGTSDADSVRGELIRPAGLHPEE